VQSKAGDYASQSARARAAGVFIFGKTMSSLPKEGGGHPADRGRGSPRHVAAGASSMCCS